MTEEKLVPSVRSQHWSEPTVTDAKVFQNVCKQIQFKILSKEHSCFEQLFFFSLLLSLAMYSRNLKVSIKPNSAPLTTYMQHVCPLTTTKRCQKK